MGSGSPTRTSKSCRDTFGQKEVHDDQGWLTHQLVFPKQVIDANLRRDDADDLVQGRPSGGRARERGVGGWEHLTRCRSSLQSVAHASTGHTAAVPEAMPHCQMVLDPRNEEGRELIREHEHRQRKLEAARRGLGGPTAPGSAGNRTSASASTGAASSSSGRWDRDRR